MFFALLMVGSPGVSIVGHDADLGIADNAAASPGDRALRLGIVGAVGSIATLNPLEYTMAEEMLVIWPCYSTLLSYDVNVKEIGDLARTWSTTPDGKTWTFHLYETAVFYDKNSAGPYVQVTANDVMWTFFAIQNDTKNNLHSYFPNVGGQPIIQSMAVGPTPWDLTIQLSSQYAPFLGSLHSIPILPKYIWEGQALTWNNYDNSPLIAPLIGSGPFYYNQAGLPSGTVVELVRSPTWFATEEHGWQLHVNKMVIKSQTSADSNLADFQAGGVDAMLWATSEQYEGALADMETAGTATRFHSSTGFVYEYNLNQMTDAMRADLGGTYNRGSNNQLLLDPVVREAIAMSYDKQQFIDEVYGGLGQPADSLVPFAHPYYYDYGGVDAPPGEVEITQDIAGARLKLYNNGWQYKTAADGAGHITYGSPEYYTYVPLCKIGGTSELSFRFWTLSESQEWNTGGQLLMNWSDQIGVNLRGDYALKSSNEMNGAWMAADYDMWLWDWVFTPTSEVSVDILSVLTTEEIGSWSDIYWSNPEFDALYNESLVTMDFASRKAITDELQRINYEANACQLLAYRADLFAVRSVPASQSPTADQWVNWGDWSVNWLLDPSQLAPWIYMMIEPGAFADNQAPDISTQATYDGIADTGLSVTATATDDSVQQGTGLQYRWFYGDGTKDAVWSSTPGRTHAYDTDGKYTAYVAVKETGTGAEFISWTKTLVTVVDLSNFAPENVDFVYSPLDPDSGTIVFLNGSATDINVGDQLYYSWDFGDGTGGVGQQVTHQFTGGVPSYVTVYVDDHHLGTGDRPVPRQKLVSVSANTAPSWSVPDYPVVTVRQVTTFTGTMSDPDARDQHRYTWFWGDGSFSVTTTPSTTHRYQLKGVMTLVTWCDDLTGLPNHNRSDTSIVGVSAPNNKVPSISSFLVDNGAPVIGAVSTFTLLATDQDTSDVLTMNIDFGDGMTEWVNLTQGTPWVVQHTYPTWGTYDAWATITDNQAAPQQDFTTVDVTPMTFSLSLYAGYNFVTVPLIGWGYTANNLGLTFGNVVSGWDNATQTYSQGFIVGLSPPSTAFDIEPSTGYWIYTGTAKTLTLYGRLPTVDTMTRPVLVPSPDGGYVAFGMNTLKTTMKASDIVANYSGSINVVSRWNAATGTYQSYITIFPMTDFVLSPGQGYWVYCVDSGSFSYDVL
ncbi:MAG: hypothetical protein A3K60_02190 [Euryarchaeota archaeon RBG_19FT_COMBO_56_21]|nr:MAG: hypothetical protein A3K60_02190 [Euryarchaeota archaeon RBG_19FT_COMBO_56_21]